MTSNINEALADIRDYFQARAEAANVEAQLLEGVEEIIRAVKNPYWR